MLSFLLIKTSLSLLPHAQKLCICQNIKAKPHLAKTIKCPNHSQPFSSQVSILGNGEIVSIYLFCFAFPYSCCWYSSLHGFRNFQILRRFSGFLDDRSRQKPMQTETKSCVRRRIKSLKNGFLFQLLPQDFPNHSYFCFLPLFYCTITITEFQRYTSESEASEFVQEAQIHLRLSQENQQTCCQDNQGNSSPLLLVSKFQFFHINYFCMINFFFSFYRVQMVISLIVY